MGEVLSAYLVHHLCIHPHLRSVYKEPHCNNVAANSQQRSRTRKKYTNSLLQQETMESYNETLHLSQLGNDKNVTMATSEQQQLVMAAHIELLNKSGGRGEAIGGELVNYRGPPPACIIL